MVDTKTNAPKWESELLEYVLGKKPVNADEAVEVDQKNVDTPSHEEVPTDKAKLDSPVKNAVIFESEAERENASKFLMGCGIPWKEMGEVDTKSYMKFRDKDFPEACKCLSNQYNFVDAEPRKVAVIEFDDIWLYEKVLNYMKRMGAVLEYGGDHRLDDLYEEDLIDVDKKHRPKGKKTALSYCAKNKKLKEDNNVDIRLSGDRKKCKARRNWSGKYA